MRKIKEKFVHCTATKQTATSEDIARIWKWPCFDVGELRDILG